MPAIPKGLKDFLAREAFNTGMFAGFLPDEERQEYVLRAKSSVWQRHGVRQAKLFSDLAHAFTLPDVHTEYLAMWREGKTPFDAENCTKHWLPAVTYGGWR